MSAGVPSLTPLGLRADLSPGTVFLLQLIFTCVRVKAMQDSSQMKFICWGFVRKKVNLLQHQLPLGTTDRHRAALEVDVDNVAIRSASYNVVPVLTSSVSIVSFENF